jgi:hypothetical protein
MMRLLIEITSTLDRLPEDRYIFMKMEYNESAPEDYEPPLFQAASEEQREGYFMHKPFTMYAAHQPVPVPESWCAVATSCSRLCFTMAVSHQTGFKTSVDRRHAQRLSIN